MKLHVISDLHNEFVPFRPDPAAVEACDVVVLAGDIDTGTRGLAWARQVFGSKPIVCVAGNHEFYGHHWTKLLSQLRDEAKRLSVHFLEDSSVEIEGVQFLGCALWTDFAYFQDRPVGSSMRACEIGMNDFRRIRASPLPIVPTSAPPRIHHWSRLTAQHVRVRHEASKKWLAQELQAAQDQGKRPIVVTHHLPSSRSVAPQFAQDDLTPAYASHLDELIPLAELWIHGHTHDSVAYEVASPRGSTRIVCNPRGYSLGRGEAAVAENSNFDPALIIEV